MSIPELATDRLILRQLRQGDAADMFAYAQDPLVAHPGMWEPYASFDDCERHVEHLIGLYERHLMWWAMEHRADGRLIGRVELSDWSRDDARASLSYALNREFWGQGLMTEAVAEVVRYGREQLGLHRLEATVLPDNQASVRILQRLGMQPEGLLRDYRRLGGKWIDVAVYAVVNPAGT